MTDEDRHNYAVMTGILAFVLAAEIVSILMFRYVISTPTVIATYSTFEIIAMISTSSFCGGVCGGLAGWRLGRRFPRHIWGVSLLWSLQILAMCLIPLVVTDTPLRVDYQVKLAGLVMLYAAMPYFLRWAWKRQRQRAKLIEDLNQADSARPTHL